MTTARSAVRWIALLLTITLASSVAGAPATAPTANGAAPEPDLSSPESASKALVRAIRVGDVATLRAITVRRPYWEPVIDALGVAGREQAKLIDAVTARWGAGATQHFIGLQDAPLPDGYVLKINGDRAALVDEKYPDFPTPQRYVREDGKWKIDWITGREEHEAAEFIGFHQHDARTTAAFVERIRAGEFSSPAAADKAYREALDEKFARAAEAKAREGKAAGAATAPSATPSTRASGRASAPRASASSSPPPATTPRAYVPLDDPEIEARAQALARRPMVHDALTPEQTARVRRLLEIFAEVEEDTFEAWVLNLRREPDLEGELQRRETTARTFTAYCKGKELSVAAKKEVQEIAYLRTLASEEEVLEVAELKLLSPQQARAVMRHHRASDPAASSRASPVE